MTAEEIVKKIPRNAPDVKLFHYVEIKKKNINRQTLRKVFKLLQKEGYLLQMGFNTSKTDKTIELHAIELPVELKELPLNELIMQAHKWS